MILFDGDRYEMKGKISHYPAGQTTAVDQGTPYKKYFTSTDYIYCPSPYECEIHIAGVQALAVNCNLRRSAIIKVGICYFELYLIKI